MRERQQRDNQEEADGTSHSVEYNRALHHLELEPDRVSVGTGQWRLSRPGSNFHIVFAWLEGRHEGERTAPAAESGRGQLHDARHSVTGIHDLGSRADACADTHLSAEGRVPNVTAKGISANQALPI